jgi:pimeloyl-ACP methyl ester carboxylesterase
MAFFHLMVGRHGVVLLLAFLFLLNACDGNEAESTATATSSFDDSQDGSVEAVPPTTAADTEVPPTVEPTATAVPEPTATDEPEPTATTEAEIIETDVLQTAAQFSEDACEFDVPPGRDVTCGWLTVPEDRSDPGNNSSIQLHVAIFSSDSPNPAPDPIVYLEGGPGGDALEAIPLVFERRFAPFLTNHELIMFDQRGTGYSQPSLACPETAELTFELLEQDISPEAASELNVEALLDCRDRLVAEGVNLAAYNSAQSAADLNDLRLALGVDAWNVWGISYGTRLAQTAMRDYPEGIRSVILDSAYPLQTNLLTDTPANLARALDVLFAGCAAEPTCNEAYPNLESVFYETVAQLNEEKIILPVNNVLTGESYDAYFSGYDLLGVLFQSLYATEIIPDLPKLIYDVNEGETTNLSALLSSFLLNTEFVSIGMQFSVQCYEENSFTNPDEVMAAVEAYPELVGIFQYSINVGVLALSICDVWEAGTAEALENVPVTSDIPTLILAGGYDPITPPAWGRLVQESLSNAYYYEFPGTGHGASLSGDCALAVIESFLASPSDEPDSSCLADVGNPDFMVAGGTPEEITLVPFENELFGIMGVVPEGWMEVTAGTYSRGSSGLDQTVIIQQAALGVSAEQLLGVLASQLGWESVPESSESYGDGNGRTWTLYAVDVQGFPANIALTEEEGLTFLVLLISSAEEEARLYDDVFIPALEVLTVLE